MVKNHISKYSRQRHDSDNILANYVSSIFSLFWQRIWVQNSIFQYRVTLSKVHIINWLSIEVTEIRRKHYFSRRNLFMYLFNERLRCGFHDQKKKRPSDLTTIDQWKALQEFQFCDQWVSKISPSERLNSILIERAGRNVIQLYNFGVTFHSTPPYDPVVIRRTKQWVFVWVDLSDKLCQKFKQFHSHFSILKTMRLMAPTTIT